MDPHAKSAPLESVFSTLVTEVVAREEFMFQRPSSSTDGRYAEQQNACCSSLHIGDKAMPLSHLDLECVSVIWNVEHGLLALPLVHPPTHFDIH
jgi:hypothetical protein